MITGAQDRPRGEARDHVELTRVEADRLARVQREHRAGHVRLAAHLDREVQLAGLDEFGDVVRSAIGPNGGTNGLSFETPLTDDDVLAVRRFSETIEADEHRMLRREVRAWVTGTTEG